jgi:hypothetical protein
VVQIAIANRKPLLGIPDGEVRVVGDADIGASDVGSGGDRPVSYDKIERHRETFR